MIIEFIFGNKAKSFLAKYELSTSYYTGVTELPHSGCQGEFIAVATK